LTASLVSDTNVLHTSDNTIAYIGTLAGSNERSAQIDCL